MRVDHLEKRRQVASLRGARQHRCMMDNGLSQLDLVIELPLEAQVLSFLYARSYYRHYSFGKSAEKKIASWLDGTGVLRDPRRALKPEPFLRVEVAS